MSEIKLKPCPFCGGKAWTFHIPTNNEYEMKLHEWIWLAPGRWLVGCDTQLCMLNINNMPETFASEQEAAEAWNKRAVLPSAQPEQRWIPCSKRLPPELKPVNVTWINRQPPTCYENLKDKPFTDTAVIYEGKWYWQSAVCVDLLKEYGESPADDVEDAIDIVAWMPLPEPYEDVNRMDDLISRQAAIKALQENVAHAHWKDAVQGCHDSPHVICSACGGYFWQYFKTFRYCPNCGAKMDEVSG